MEDSRGVERRTSRYNGHAQPLALLVRALKVGPISFEIGEVLGRRRTQQKEAKDAAEKPRLRNERRLRDRPSSHFEKNPAGDRDGYIGPPAEALRSEGRTLRGRRAPAPQSRWRMPRSKTRRRARPTMRAPP